MAFGEIPGNPPGTTYTSYEEMVAVVIHRQNFVTDPPSLGPLN
jgi:hypothetical protein